MSADLMAIRSDEVVRRYRDVERTGALSHMRPTNRSIVLKAICDAVASDANLDFVIDDVAGDPTPLLSSTSTVEATVREALSRRLLALAQSQIMPDEREVEREDALRVDGHPDAVTS